MVNYWAIRIQFVCNDKLIAEVIVESMKEADKVVAAYFNRRYDKHKPMGGAAIRLASIKRHWDIPVGATIED